MKILLSIATGLVVATALITSWLGFHSARQARAALADLSAQRAKLETQIVSVQEHVSSATRDASDLQTSLQRVQTAAEKRSLPAAAPKPATAPTTPPDVSALMAANPELRTLFKRAFQANLALRYLPFYHAAALSPAQILKFEELMTEAEQDKMDLQSATKIQGLAANDPAIAKMRQQAEAKLQTAQTEILGESGYQQLQQYKRSEPLLGFVNDVASLVAHTSSPFTAAQSEQLLTTLASASSRYEAGGAADILTVDWPRALAQAQNILPPAQFAALKANAQNAQVFALVKQFYQQQGATTGK